MANDVDHCHRPNGDGNYDRDTSNIHVYYDRDTSNIHGYYDRDTSNIHG